MGSKVKVTETFAGGGITIDGSPLKTVLFFWRRKIMFFYAFRFICVYVCVFCVYPVILHMCCIIVARWAVPDWIEA